MPEKTDMLSVNMVIKIRWEYVKKSFEFPLGIYFAVMGFIRKNNCFEEVIRIDNAAHRGKTGSHIHYLDKPLRKGKEVIGDVKEIVHYSQAWVVVFDYLIKNYAYTLEER